MPESIPDWMWWIFTAIVLAIVLSVIGNLLTPLVRRGGEGWLRRRRLSHDKYRAEIQYAVKLLEDDPTVVYLQIGYRTIMTVFTSVFVAFSSLMFYFIATLDYWDLEQGATFLIRPLLIGTGLAFLYTWNRLANRILDIFIGYRDRNLPEEDPSPHMLE